MALLSALDERSVRDLGTGCLRWQGAHTPTGYGQIVIAGKPVSVHRVAWERVNGPIPEGLEIDHVYERGCRYRDCIEPTHLEAVTHQTNLERSKGFSAINAQKTHCVNGHPFDSANTLYTKQKRGTVHRNCRECKNAKRREARRKANG